MLGKEVFSRRADAIGANVPFFALRRLLKYTLCYGHRIAGHFSEPSDGGTLIILTYHRVRKGIPKEVGVDPANFERQMQYVVENYPVVAASDLLTKRAGSNGQQRVLVTFDDGYDDFYQFAFPVLRKHNIPATLFLAPGVMDGNGFYEFDKSLEACDRRLLSWRTVRELLETGLVTVGSHSMSHALLCGDDEKQLRWEVATSKEVLEARLGISIEHFAYPWGVCSPTAARLVRSVYKTSMMGGYEANCWPCDLHGLNRIGIQATDDFFLFREKLRSRLAWLRTAARIKQSLIIKGRSTIFKRSSTV